MADALRSGRSARNGRGGSNPPFGTNSEAYQRPCLAASFLRARSSVWIERSPAEAEVVGSSPTERATSLARSAQRSTEQRSLVDALLVTSAWRPVQCGHMKDLRIGVQIDEPTVPAAIDAIVRAEELGIDAAWMTVGGVQPDSTAILAVAATRTQRIKLGTSIVPTYPRHPFALAQEAKVVAELAPGRFRLGVGPSHKPPMEETWGIPFEKPLGHLREYLHILKAALQQGGRWSSEGSSSGCGQTGESPSISR